MTKQNIFGYFDDVEHEYSNQRQLIEMTMLFFGGFFISFLVGYPQIIVGSLVNAFLIRSALSLPGNKVLPVAIAPSMGVIARGLVFGPFTPFLIFLLPAIWLGNLILIYAFKNQIKNKYNYFAALIGGSVIKAGFLFAAATILFSVSIVPAAIVSAMGIIQLETALIGGIIAYLGIKAEKYF
jgi:hypothetical protein